MGWIITLGLLAFLMYKDRHRHRWWEWPLLFLLGLVIIDIVIGMEDLGVRLTGSEWHLGYTDGGAP